MSQLNFRDNFAKEYSRDYAIFGLNFSAAILAHFINRIVDVVFNKWACNTGLCFLHLTVVLHLNLKLYFSEWTPILTSMIYPWTSSG